MIQSAGAATGSLENKRSSKNYQKINGCTYSMPWWQAMGITVMVVIEILSFDLIKSMVELNHTLLYVLFGISYVFLMFVIIDYLILVLGDPADPRLANPSYKQPNEKLKHCVECEATVCQTSYHCKTCKRCVNQFDHHCVFLNNCIGKQNYSTFFRLLLTLICHMSLNMGIGISMFVQLGDAFKWVSLSFAILSFLVFLEIVILAFFHCYISFCLFKSTFQVLRGGSDKKITGETVEIQLHKKLQPESKNVVKMDQRIEESTQIVLQKGKNQL